MEAGSAWLWLQPVVQQHYRHHVRQARAAELLEGRDRARRQAEADRHAWAAERTALKSAAAGLQVHGHSNLCLCLRHRSLQTRVRCPEVHRLRNQQQLCTASSNDCCRRVELCSCCTKPHAWTLAKLLTACS